MSNHVASNYDREPNTLYNQAHQPMPRPPTIVCYICHREFGSASIGIHEKQCLNKWRDQNNKLSKSERRPEPVKPTASSKARSPVGGFEDNRPIKTTGNDPKIDYNAAASQTNLVACGRCGRKFAPDRVKNHQAHCRPAPPRKNKYEARKPDVDLAILRTPLNGKSNIPKGSPKSGTAKAANSFVACKICGRTFAPDRIARHQAGCKADPVKTQPVKNKTDGRRRSRSSGAYLNLPKGPTCPKCSAKVVVDAKFCTNCGFAIPNMCSQCGTTIPKFAKYCGNCGKPAQANKNNTRESSLLPAIPTCDRSPSPRRVFKDHPTIVCYICGLDVGARSKDLHECGCKEKRAPKKRTLEESQRYWRLLSKSPITGV